MRSMPPVVLSLSLMLAACGGPVSRTLPIIADDVLVVDLGRRLDELTVRMEMAEAVAESQSVEIDDLERELAEARDALDTVDLDEAPGEQVDLGGLVARVDELETGVDQGRADRAELLLSLSETQLAAQQAHDAALAHSAQLVLQHDRLDGADVARAALDGRLAIQEQGNGQQAAQITAVGGSVSVLTSRADATDARFVVAEDRLDAGDARFVVAEDRLDAGDARFVVAEGRLGAAEGRLTAVEASVDVLDGAASGLDYRLALVEGSVPLLRADVAEALHEVRGLTAVTADVFGAWSPVIDDAAALLAFVETDTADQAVRFVGANVFIQNGSGASDDPTNGARLGNLIIGYGEADASDVRTGWHNLVVGRHHSWSGWGGIVAGENNELAGASASVLGGEGNAAVDDFAVVVGGEANLAGDLHAVVVGGADNEALGWHAVVGGGQQNLADGAWSVVSGGRQNDASGAAAVVVGGSANGASGPWAVAVAGNDNRALYAYSTVLGGVGYTSPSMSSLVP